MCANRSLSLWLACAACALMASAVGCSYGIGVRSATKSPLLAAWRASLAEENDLSPRTQQTLRQLDLLPVYNRNPHDAYFHLHALAVQEPRPDLLFALAEICYHLGQQDEKAGDCEAVAHYYCCAGYAYHYLFAEKAAGCPRSAVREAAAALGADGRPVPLHKDLLARCPPSLPPAAFDPRFRVACDLYNNGLAKCIRAAQRVGRFDPRYQLHVPTRDGRGFLLTVDHHGFLWRPDEFGPLRFCADYEVFGLDNHFRTYGLGVPLIGIRDASAPAGPAGAFYPREVSFPVTAFFRFEGTIADLGARRIGRLQLYNPLTINRVRAGGRTVPLETDLTTPLAYFLSKTDLGGLEYTGFLRADQLRDRAGIYMFEPYQPGKIPVLMVHGLLSSPLTWTPLFNELRADPELRKHYQFWFYLYPTGNPYPLTAAELRRALHRLRNDLDPQRRDQALGQMVFVGHSMGGLVSKLLTQDSGDDFWRLVSQEPFAEVKAEPRTRRVLQRIFYFDRESEVKRVIFLGTPHHGSKLSPSPPARLLARFVRLPERLKNAAEDVARKNPGLWPNRSSDPGRITLPTSLDLLTPGAPALELLASRTAPPGVHYHSVIGVSRGEGKNGTDGVVSYASAHIDGAESEIVIPANHRSVHHHPQAVLEVKRILREHLEGIRRPAREVVPACTLLPPE